MKNQRRFIVVALLLAGLLLWIPRQRELRSRQARMESRSAELARLLEQAREERRASETLRSEIVAERAAAEAAKSQRKQVPAPTDSGGDASGSAVPPARLPDWNAGSPYVWVPKSVLSGFPLQPFGNSGELQPGMVTLLALKPEQERRLNRMLADAVKAARDAESASATLLTEPLPGLDDGPGEVVTLRVEGASEESLRIRSEVVAALTQELGAERSELLQQWGEDWFNGQFGSAESEAKVFSVRKSPDGTFALVVKTGSHQFSVDGSEVFIGYIPVHLRHWFASLEGPTSARTVPDP